MSIHEGARYAKIHIRHVLISGTFRYPATPYRRRCRIKLFTVIAFVCPHIRRGPSYCGRCCYSCPLLLLYRQSSLLLYRPLRHSASIAWLTVHKRRFTRRFHFNVIHIACCGIYCSMFAQGNSVRLRSG